MPARILVVDNYDSFVYNLVQYLGQLGAEVIVRRNDAVAPGELESLDVDGVLISPGPGTPQAAGVSMELVSACAAYAATVNGAGWKSGSPTCSTTHRCPASSPTSATSPSGAPSRSS